MKLSTWSWPTHPYDKTRGVVIGPFFRWMVYVSVPIGAFGFGVKTRKW